MTCSIVSSVSERKHQGNRSKSLKEALGRELRGAAQNGEVLRREEARKHLVESRRHFDELLALVRSDPETHAGGISICLRRKIN